MDSVVGNGCKSFGFGNLGIRSSGFTFAYKKNNHTKKTLLLGAGLGQCLQNKNTNSQPLTAHKITPNKKQIHVTLTRILLFLGQRYKSRHRSNLSWINLL